MINHEHKFIFIHIPKSGGTSIGKSLSCGKNMHETLSILVTNLESKNE